MQKVSSTSPPTTRRAELCTHADFDRAKQSTKALGKHTVAGRRVQADSDENRLQLEVSSDSGEVGGRKELELLVVLGYVGGVSA